MHKFGDTRPDGYRFKGYYNRGGKRCEMWCSPAAWEKARTQEKQYKKRYRAGRDPRIQALYNAKWRAKKRGMEFNLTLDDIVIPYRCPVLGIDLFRATGTPCDNSPEIDRRDNSRGYTRDNVVVVSRRANRLKSDATPTELMAVASFYAA